MQQTQPQQDKPQQQGELRTVVWQNGTSATESLPETLQEVLHDPDAVIWLDIQGECGPQQALLHNVFELTPITLQTIDEEKERAKFIEQEHYFYLVVHGLSFDTQTDEADTPKLDIVFGRNLGICHRWSMTMGISSGSCWLSWDLLRYFKSGISRSEGGSELFGKVTI